MPQINWHSPITKVVLVMLSFLFWAMIAQSLTFAAVLMFVILVHEYGHMWALKRSRISFDGPFVTPIGAVIIPTADIPNLQKEYFFAIMGPVAGLLLLVITTALLIATNSSIFYNACLLGVILNFFNLFPIHPLDGGRVAKAIAFSFSPKLGVGLMIASIVAVFYLAISTGFPVFFILIFLALRENLDYIRYPDVFLAFRPPMSKKQAVVALLGYILLGFILFSFLYLFDPQLEIIKRLIGWR